eukprot:3547167-Alexandrium_andersonii.AAC.1
MQVSPIGCEDCLPSIPRQRLKARLDRRTEHRKAGWGLELHLGDGVRSQTHALTHDGGHHGLHTRD